MAIEPKRIEAIVSEVLERLESGDPGRTSGASPALGVHADLDQAVAAAGSAFEAYAQVPLETRRRIIASVREILAANYRALAEVAVQETGLGRVEDKILKNRIVTERTPGTEDLEPRVWTGDSGMTLEERAPYGPIAVITPVTNPTETIINNGISMIAGGNTVVLCPHPNARKVSNLAVDLINRGARRAGAPQPLLHSVDQPTIEVAQRLLRYPGIRLNVVTGGPGVVREALDAGKKAITAGPGNPPAVVDETADLEKAARDIVAGASLDNNIICTDEKEVIAVALIADRLKEAFARNGAVVLPPHQIEQLRKLLIAEERGPRRHAVINRTYVGKNVDLILRDAGIPCDPSKRLAICEVDLDHPFLWTEMMMPVLGLARARTVDEGIDFAVAVEHGFRHTASMHSRNIEKLSKMARACDCSIFVKNGPNFAGLGWGGEGPTSFTIASPTGEGMTTARSFTRLRRCTLVDYFRIV
ncbi:MAG: aldehyde dehydrogenase EutE [Candidatus Eisenbacteria bacterium RBG_16_71_46]|nr:MAG: aldehyde dehydrogenase EutE [Candidatus Eisenbacteria bacterium RBG_16_71_46]OGF22291.1 MAG: aldehyde dehydrogenase EutE [Candidatus Eisenbacteria bacterium RBG_19FT_COMBO_70_11]